MKIAVPNGKVTNVSKMASPEDCGCKSGIAPVLRQMGVVVMLAGNMGQGAKNTLERGGADVVIECAGGEDTFEMAWKAARHNGKNLTFKIGGVDASDCAEILSFIEEGKLNTLPLITHYYPLSRIDEAYKLFENKEDRVIKVAIENHRT